MYTSPSLRNNAARASFSPTQSLKPETSFDSSLARQTSAISTSPAVKTAPENAFGTAKIEINNRNFADKLDTPLPDLSLNDFTLNTANFLTVFDRNPPDLSLKNPIPDYSHLETDITYLGREAPPPPPPPAKKTKDPSTSFFGKETASTPQTSSPFSRQAITLSQLQHGNTRLSPETVMLSRTPKSESNNLLPNMSEQLEMRDKYREASGKSSHLKLQLNSEMAALKDKNPEFEKADEVMAETIQAYTPAAIKPQSPSKDTSLRGYIGSLASSTYNYAAHALNPFNIFKKKEAPVAKPVENVVPPTKDETIANAVTGFQDSRTLTSKDGFVNELVLMHDSVHSLNREHNNADHPSRVISHLLEPRAEKSQTGVVATKDMNKLISDYVEYRMLKSALS